MLVKTQNKLAEQRTMNTQSLFDTLGKRVRILRTDRGLKQIELVEQMRQYGVQIGSTQISKIESGQTQPSIEVLGALVRVLETTSDYLLLLSDDPRPSAPEPPGYISQEADEVAHIIDGLPAEVRAEAVAIARRLARPVQGRAEREREILWWLARVEEIAGGAARQALERLIMRGENGPHG